MIENCKPKIFKKEGSVKGKEEKLFSTSEIKRFDINTGLSDDLFDPDKIEGPTITREEMMEKMQEMQKKKEK